MTARKRENMRFFSFLRLLGCVGDRGVDGYGKKKKLYREGENRRQLADTTTTEASRQGNSNTTTTHTPTFPEWGGVFPFIHLSNFEMIFHAGTFFSRWQFL